MVSSRAFVLVVVSLCPADHMRQVKPMRRKTVSTKPSPAFWSGLNVRPRRCIRRPRRLQQFCADESERDDDDGGGEQGQRLAGMLDAESVSDGADGLAHEKEKRMQRQRSRA